MPYNNPYMMASNPGLPMGGGMGPIQPNPQALVAQLSQPVADPMMPGVMPGMMAAHNMPTPGPMMPLPGPAGPMMSGEFSPPPPPGLDPMGGPPPEPVNPYADAMTKLYDRAQPISPGAGGMGGY